MSRAYQARRRRHTAAPVTFDVDYLVDVDEPFLLNQTDKNTGEVRQVASTRKVTVGRRETFTCVGDISGLALSELAFHDDSPTTDPAAIKLVREVLRGAFGNDAEYQRFFYFHLQHLDDEDLFDIVGGLVEDFAARPTVQPSSSPSSPSAIGPDSRPDMGSGFELPGGYRLEAVPQLEDPPPPAESAIS